MTPISSFFTATALALFVPLAVAQPQQPVEFVLHISQIDAAPAGRTVKQLVVNGSSPGPVLRFREGDLARITVHNDLKSEHSSIHWHGLLVPNLMDGVPYLTTPSIPPGGKWVFEFPIRQSGTYWYHSHTGFQEQRGVQGAIVIAPKKPDLAFDREHVIVLSDWTDEHPHEVMRTLMRGSDWYALKKANMQSWLGAWRAGALADYVDRERVRMPPMDISDVAYDAFLANGRRQLDLAAKPGERVLLRVINAGASTYFHISSGDGPLSIVGSDGKRVVPVSVKRLLMGMAETYDLIVTMPAQPARIEVRATAHDSSGHASIYLGEGPLLAASDPPKPDLYRMDEMIQAGLASTNPVRGKRAADADRPFAPYSLLRSTEPTNFADSTEVPRAVRKITMRLTGDMRRYRWGFDDKSLTEETTIRVKRGEVLRIEFINDTMMHHPLHLHGHFFRLLNGQADHAPLKHTVDVPPMGKRIIEWLAEEPDGDWFFHCHMLYHMDAGMARVFSYSQDPDHLPSLDPKLIDPYFWFLDGSVQNHMTMGRFMVMSGRNDYFLRWDAALRRPHLDDREIDVGWSRYLDANLATEVGFRFSEVHGTEDRAFAGIRYRLPYMVHSSLTVDSEGDFRASLEKEFQLTDRLSFAADVEYDTNTYTEWSVGVSWTLDKQFDLLTSYHSDHGYGVGMSFRF